jgi:hypothetical protein
MAGRKPVKQAVRSSFIGRFLLGSWVIVMQVLIPYFGKNEQKNLQVKLFDEFRAEISLVLKLQLEA